MKRSWLRTGLVGLGAGFLFLPAWARGDGTGSGGGVRGRGQDRIVDVLGSTAAGRSANLSGSVESGLIYVVSRPTPILLISFSATVENGLVRLEWRVSEDSTPLGFHVYRSPSREGPFERRTADPLPASARLFEEPAGDGVLWYRLSGMDRDGGEVHFGAVSVDAASPPVKLVLHQNAPNPARPSTMFALDLPEPGPVRLRVFDVAGRVAAVVFEGVLAAGRHFFPWDAGAVSAGVYLYALEAAGKVETRKMVIGP